MHYQKKKKRHVMKVRSGQLWLLCPWSSHMSNCLWCTQYTGQNQQEKKAPEPSSKITHQCYRYSKSSDLIKRNHVAMELCWSIWTVSPYVPYVHVSHLGAVLIKISELLSGKLLLPVTHLHKYSCNILFICTYTALHIPLYHSSFPFLRQSGICIYISRGKNYAAKSRWIRTGPPKGSKLSILA